MAEQVKTQFLAIAKPILGLRASSHVQEYLDPRSMIDCSNIEFDHENVAMAMGWSRYENMVAADLPDRQGAPITLITEHVKFDGFPQLVIGTTQDLYKRTGIKTYALITPTYKTGLASVSGDGLTVTLSGGGSTDNFGIGQRFKVDANGAWKTIAAITSGTVFTLDSAYPGSPHANVAYTVRKTFQSVSLRYKWIAQLINENLILCNPRVAVYSWDGTAETVTELYSATKLQAKTVASFGARPVFADISENGARKRQRIRWPNDNTISDFEIKPGSTAGFMDVTSSPDFCMALAILGNLLVLYKERSIHVLQFIGAPFTFGRQQVRSEIGIIGPLAGASLGDFHVFLGTDNVYLFDGIKVTPIGDDVIDLIVADLDPAKREEVIALNNFEMKIVYFVIPKLGGGYVAYAWHYGTPFSESDKGSWSKRDLPATAAGQVSLRSYRTWDQMTSGWNTYTTPWDEASFSTFYPQLLFGNEAGEILHLNGNNTQDGATITASATFASLGTRLGDADLTNLLKEILMVEPWVVSPLNGQVTSIYIGKENGIRGTFVFSGAFPWDVANGRRGVSPRISGTCFAIKFETQVPGWEMAGYGVRMGLLGERRD